MVRIARRGRTQRSPVAAGATLPGGYAVDGLTQLKQHLLQHERQRFGRAVVAKLLTYALGRPLELSDEVTVQSLADKFAAADYRVSDLIVAIVQSEPFQHK